MIEHVGPRAHDHHENDAQNLPMSSEDAFEKGGVLGMGGGGDALRQSWQEQGFLMEGRTRKGPCTQLVYTLAPKYLHRDNIKAKVCIYVYIYIYIYRRYMTWTLRGSTKKWSLTPTPPPP